VKRVFEFSVVWSKSEGVSVLRRGGLKVEGERVVLMKEREEHERVVEGFCRLFEGRDGGLKVSKESKDGGKVETER